MASNQTLRGNANNLFAFAMSQSMAAIAGRRIDKHKRVNNLNNAVIIEQAGHLMQLTHAKQANRSPQRFLATCGRSTAISLAQSNTGTGAV